MRPAMEPIGSEPDASAPEGPGARSERGRFLVREARRRMPLHWLPVIVALTLAYAVVCGLVPFNSQSYIAVFNQTLLFFLCMVFIIMPPNGDRLATFRVASIFFVISFCIGDLFNEERLVWFFIHSYPDLLARATTLALLCYVMMIAGYHLPFFRPIPSSIPARHERVDPGRIVPIALAFFFTGVFFWTIFFGAAGGAAVVLQGEGNVARAHFGRGHGIFFWPAMWMTSGGVMYYAAKLAQRERRLWVAIWPLALEFVLLSLLQGRHRALGPLLMALAVTHYLVRPVRLPRVALYASVALLFAMTVSLVRSPAYRSDFYRDPGAAVQIIGSSFYDQFAHVMVGDLGCVWKTMITIDKVPEVMPYANGKTMLIPFNPLFRLLDLDHLQALPLGSQGYMLARPELNLDINTTTGFLPSLVGEFRWNFPWPICLFFYMGYGIVLRLIYQKLIVDRGDFASVAIYATMGLYFVEQTFQSPTQNIFEMADVVAPMILIRALALRSPRTVAMLEQRRRQPLPPGSGPAAALHDATGET